MAASIVIASYDDPIDTWHSNLIGTVNVLEARDIDNLKAVLCITTDKCYRNINKLEGYSGMMLWVVLIHIAPNDM